jgi:hypothetical protein
MIYAPKGYPLSSGTVNLPMESYWANEKHGKQGLIAGVAKKSGECRLEAFAVILRLRPTRLQRLADDPVHLPFAVLKVKSLLVGAQLVFGQKR